MTSKSPPILVAPNAIRYFQCRQSVTKLSCTHQVATGSNPVKQSTMWCGQGGSFFINVNWIFGSHLTLSDYLGFLYKAPEGREDVACTTVVSTSFYLGGGNSAKFMQRSFIAIAGVSSIGV